MATALDRGGAEGRKSRGRRRRARERAEAVADAAVTIPVTDGLPADEPSPTPEPETAISPAAAAESPPVTATAGESVASPRPDRIRPRRRAERPMPVLESAPRPDETLTVEAAPPVDDFFDLLGQAVGLRLDSVTREFDGGDSKVAAIRDVSLEIAPGEFVSIIGPSGCGKTTLLSMMGGLDSPTSGNVYAAGMALDQLSEDALADYRLQRVSTIFQTFNLTSSMSVEENVALPLLLAGVEPAVRKERARHLLDLVGLKGRATVRASRLSGGEQQRVAVARALANRPGLILADEPTGSLDSAGGERILELLKDLNRRGATVVLVTHDPQVARYAQRAVRMVDGRAFELDSGGRNVRKQDPVLPPARLHWRDTVRLGFISAGRRPLRTFLTTTGVAIGIAAMSLIVALSGGLAYALGGPGLAPTRIDEVAVRPPADAVSASFDAATLAALASQPHVRAAWGEVVIPGSFTNPTATTAHPGGELLSLPPKAEWGGAVTIVAGGMPASDMASEVVLGAREAALLGFASPDAAVGRNILFTAAAKTASAMPMRVVGVMADPVMPEGGTGGFVPYGLITDQWANLASANGWHGGEFTGVTLLADSDANVDRVRNEVQALGFQVQTTGDQLRAFEELLGRLRVALLGLSVVALLLACLGIANTMYTAVLERTREIGILKSVGARSRDIMLLFVAEAAVIGLAGGIVGGGVAAELARFGNSAVDALVPPVAGAAVEVFRPDLVVAIGALLVAVALSIGSGLLPAMRAAAQQPMKALHHE